MRRFWRWFLPGLGIKRWFVVFACGVFLASLALSLAFGAEVYSRVERYFAEFLFRDLDEWPLVRWAIVATLAAGGVALAFWGMARIVGAVLDTLLPVASVGKVGDRYVRRRALLRGPRVVAIGGGTGIPNLLRGVKAYTSNLTAIVTVADDGGSSGRLRNQFGILPPGDIRNCLLALADTEPLMEQVFQHRFSQGDGLAGHSLGNLFILALTEITGDFEQAVRASSQVLAVRGRVLPSTLSDVVLKGELADGRIVNGESNLSGAGSPIRRVFLEPAGAQPLGDALQAIMEADVIVLGPGSLFTSVLPNLLVPGMADALRSSRALKVYACNIMTEPGETDGFGASHHLKALFEHAGPGVVQYCLANSAPVPRHLLERYRTQGQKPVQVDAAEVERLGVRLVQADLLDGGDYVRHSPEKLAGAIGRLILRNQDDMDRPPWDFYLLRQQLQRRAGRQQ